jgi:hypothetical protein
MSDRTAHWVRVGQPDRRFLILVVGSGLAWGLFQLVLSLVMAARGHWPRDLYRDPIAIGHLPLYSGLISDIGCMMMTATAAFALLTYASLSAEERTQRRFILWGGLLSLLLASDDLLLFHDGYFPRFGVSEAVTQIVYALLMLSWLVLSRESLLKTGANGVLLLLGLAGLGASAAFDMAEDIVPTLGVLEEPSKQMGILFWMMFFFRTCLAIIRDGSLPRRA